MTSNDQEFLVQKIRTQYTEKQHTELDALKELDAKVKRPANVFAYTYGSASAIVMGAGMSLVMTEIGELFFRRVDGLTVTHNVQMHGVLLSESKNRHRNDTGILCIMNSDG